MFELHEKFQSKKTLGKYEFYVFKIGLISRARNWPTIKIYSDWLKK